MAIIKCKECGNKVSSKANICPHCGIDSPKSFMSSIGEFFQGLFGLFIIISIIHSCSNRTSKNGEKTIEKTSSNYELDETQVLLNQLSEAKSNTECFNIYAKLHKLHQNNEYLSERMECSKRFRVKEAEVIENDTGNNIVDANFANQCASAARNILNEQPYGWDVEVSFMPDMLIMEKVGGINGRIIYNNIGTLYIKNAFNAKRKSKVSCVYNTINKEIVWLRIGHTTYISKTE